MLILEKTASTTKQVTPYLEYESLIIENLSDTAVKVQTSFLDLRGQMVNDGAVVDTLEAYGVLQYSQVMTRKKRFWGFSNEVVSEIGMVGFWTTSGTADIRFKAFNGAAQKARQWLGLKSKGVERGNDTTAVSTTNVAFTLKKTLSFYSVPSSKPISSFVGTFKESADGGDYRITVETATMGETTDRTVSIVDTDYYVSGYDLAADYYGAYVIIRLYLRNTTGNTAYNEDLYVFGDNVEEIYYA